MIRRQSPIEPAFRATGAFAIGPRLRAAAPDALISGVPAAKMVPPPRLERGTSRSTIIGPTFPRLPLNAIEFVVSCIFLSARHIVYSRFPFNSHFGSAPDESQDHSRPRESAGAGGERPNHFR